MKRHIQRFGIQRSTGMAAFDVPVGPHTTVLEALEYIRVNLADDLLYRHSCHHGSCGTCGMLINGERRLACLTNVAALVAAVVEIRPLQTEASIGDLAVEPYHLFADFPRKTTYLRDSEPVADTSALPEVGTSQRFEDCIECGLCASACPVARRFMGPAALAAYHREAINRPDRREHLLQEIARPEGVDTCQRALACSAVCPTGVYPAKHIMQLRRALLRQNPAHDSDAQNDSDAHDSQYEAGAPDS